MFLEQRCEFKQVEFTPFVNEKKFVENVYFCMPPLPFYNRADQLEQEKFKHACCMCTTDNLLSLFSCVEKGIEFCSDSRRVLGNLLC